MAYDDVYDASSISAVFIDLIVGVGAGLFSFVTLLGLVFLWRWVKGDKFVK